MQRASGPLGRSYAARYNILHGHNKKRSESRFFFSRAFFDRRMFSSKDWSVSRHVGRNATERALLVGHSLRASGFFFFYLNSFRSRFPYKCTGGSEIPYHERVKSKWLRTRPEESKTACGCLGILLAHASPAVPASRLPAR